LIAYVFRAQIKNKQQANKQVQGDALLNCPVAVALELKSTKEIREREK
jgi:hypothetical protein